MARAYAKYRWKRVVVHFVTRQPTSVTGEIALVWSGNALEPAENGASGTFLARVMSRGNAILGPIWTNHSMEVPCDSNWRLVDPLTSGAFADNVMGEVQAYTLAGVTDTAGYLLVDYELEFKDTMFTPHSSLLPVSSGAGQQATLVDTSATPTANNAVIVGGGGVVTTTSNGAIWKIIITADASTPATGTTLANAWNIGISYNSSTTAETTVTLNTPISDGMTVYGAVLSTTQVALYSTLEGAIAGSASSQLFYRTTGASAASWSTVCYLVRLPLDRIALAN